MFLFQRFGDGTERDRRANAASWSAAVPLLAADVTPWIHGSLAGAPTAPFDLGTACTRPCSADHGDIQMIHVPQQTTVRFTEEDIALLDAIQERTGIVSRSEILRRAIRVLAEREGVSKLPARRKLQPRSA